MFFNHLSMPYALRIWFNQDQGWRDIEAVIHSIHRSQGPDTKVGCVGYCLGGRLACMTATRTDISASVGYYGVGIDNLLREAHAIANPVMLHVATADHFVAPAIGRASCRERVCQ